MWEDLLVVRLGAEPALWVSIAVDSARHAAMLREFLDAWVVNDPPSWLLEHPPSFVLRFVATNERLGSAAPMLQISRGRDPVYRSRDERDVMSALAWLLGGVHAQALEPSAPWWTGRVWAAGGSAVLGLATGGLPANDRVLAESGVRELPVWAVLPRPAGVVEVPAPLPGLKWSVLGDAPMPEDGVMHTLAGMVCVGAVTEAEALLSGARGCANTGSFAGFVASAEVVPVERVANRAAARRAIADLLGDEYQAN